ncbi:hypothetical protein BASA83_005740 [Batrachochytrium salamandrivorans]|nr:hypothetical protein BASA83_005740 [Batrachochytrium salamandrivorans]
MGDWPRQVVAGTGIVCAHEMASIHIPTEGPMAMSALDRHSLRLQFAANGFALLRNALPVEKVMAARQIVVDDLHSNGFLDDTAMPSALSTSKESEDASGYASGDASGYERHGQRDAPIRRGLQTDSAGHQDVDNSKGQPTTRQSPQLLSRQEWIQSQPELMSLFQHEHLQALAEMLLGDSLPVHHDDSSSEMSHMEPQCDLTQSHDAMDREDDNTSDSSDGASSIESTSTTGSDRYSTTASMPFKWLRAVGTGLYTGLHCDRVYVGHISTRQLTLWIPIGHVSTEMGSIVVSSGSHSNRIWSSVRESYGSGRAGVDGTQSGWLCLDPREIERQLLPAHPSSTESLDWMTADFRPGDICALDLNVMHMSATNTTDTWRLSCDTRWLSIDDY